MTYNAAVTPQATNTKRRWYQNGESVSLAIV